LLVQFDHAAAASLRAFDGATGNELWQAERTDIAWGSPVCVNTGTRDELILTCSTGVASYDPLTGRLLWNEDCLSAEVGTSAAYANGMVFVANAYTQGSALRIAAPPAEPPVTIVWQTHEYLPESASPLATTQGVYFATSDGTIACLDPATGALRWSKEFDSGFYASPVLAAGRVYALDLDGVMHVFDDANAYTERATSPLGEPAAATPAFVGERVYLRGEEHLFCVKVSDD
jgi:outer membrane protein assembly factor BamB